MKYLAILLFIQISFPAFSKENENERDIFNKYLDKHLLIPNSYDTTTELGRLKKQYDELIMRYLYLQRKVVEDSILIAKSNLYLKLMEHPDLFDGDTVPCGAPLGDLGHRIATPLHIKGFIDKSFRGLTSKSNYCVQYVDGIKLPKPVFIRFSSNSRDLPDFDKLSDKTKIEFFGYETGEYVGSPPGINTGSQFSWQFWREFVVLDVISIDNSSWPFENSR